ncbi:hypothetical protein HDU92_008467 [Lobulomyces angularis]|nr:hypothetical protein HDU92_008467 [Lobulomyces angularis]
MDTNIKIDRDLGYSKPIYTMFGNELAKNVVCYENPIEDFILYECNAQRKSAYSSTYYMDTSGTFILFFKGLERFLKIMEPPKVYAYWNGREVITTENTTIKMTAF